MEWRLLILMPMWLSLISLELTVLYGVKLNCKDMVACITFVLIIVES